MPRPRVYVETTIPSAYYEQRSTPEMVARRGWTRRWWKMARVEYDLFTSAPVLNELAAGPVHRRGSWLSLMSGLTLLDVEADVWTIVAAYQKHKLMPGGISGDALHLALASYHKCEFLVTWDYKHLANPNKFNHIRQVNALLGLFVPVITTPLGLLGEAYE